MKERFLYTIIAIAVFCFFVYDYFTDDANKSEADLLQTIQNRGYITVGVKTDTKPFGFINNKGKNDGYDIDIAKRIAKDIFKNPNKVKFVPVTPSTRLYVLNSGKVDMIIATMTVTHERQNQVNFSKTYFQAGQSILVNSGSNCYSLADLNDKNVGVLYGSTAEKNIRFLINSAKVKGYKTYNEAYSALKARKIVAITSDDTILRNYAINDPTVKLLPKRYSKEFYSVAVRRQPENDKLLSQINMTINDMTDDGSLMLLRRKWKLN